MHEERVRVLVTVKAYPQPSRSYGETVCVAGVRIDTNPPTWIRLYPVAYRQLEFAERFAKYQVMDLNVFRSSKDQRPESYRPNIPSARLGEKIGTQGRWAARWAYLDSLAGAVSACELRTKQGSAGAPSLGLIKPREVIRLDVEPNESFREDKTRLAQLAAQGDLFSAESRTALEPAPYRLKYYYRCAETSCPGHRQTLIDWEAGQAARRWRDAGYPDRELPERLREKFYTEMCGTDRDTYFFLGNQHLRPKGFLVLGVFWPPSGSRPDPTLF